MVIQRQLGHANLAITSVYLRGIDHTEIIHTIHERRPPMISASVGLRDKDSLPVPPAGRLAGSRDRPSLTTDVR